MNKQEEEIFFKAPTMSTDVSSGIPAPIAARDPEDQQPEQYVGDDHGGKLGGEDEDAAAGIKSDTHVGNLEEGAKDDDDEKRVSYVPSAIPQEREVEHPKSYFAHKLACITFTLVAIIAVIGGVCGSGHCGGGSSETAVAVTSAPTSYRSTLLSEFETKILETFGDDYFDEENDLFDVRKLALYWIVNEDPMQLESTADNLIQRYILTVFYFQTSQESQWIECGAGGPKLCYYKLFVHESTTAGNSWLTDNHECFWATITCGGNKTVEQIHIFDNGLHGSIPTELVGLSNLKDLYLVGNNLTGSIPTELAQLTTLELINFGRNQLEGEIDWMVFEPMHNLAQLRLHENSFTGSISSDIQFFPGSRLVLNKNDLTGSFPPEFYSLTSLVWWTANDNRITGTIATEISRMVNLSHLDLSNTLMSGAIPSEIGLIEKLVDVDISSSNMGGSLPEELFTGLASLKYVDVSNCAFSGTINTNIGLKTSLRILNLANNAFGGSIPSEISSLTGLIDFAVNGNQFTGTFPESVCTNSFTSKMEINEIVADCLPDEDTKNVAMECECCTECCSPRTKICQEV